MNDEDFMHLIDIVKSQLSQAGLNDLAEDDRYLIRSEGDGFEARLPPPQKHLIELLLAFERHLIVNTVQTARNALRSINQTSFSEGGSIEDVQIQPFDRASVGFEPEAYPSLLQGPDYAETLIEVRKLINGIRDTGPEEETR